MRLLVLLVSLVFLAFTVHEELKKREWYSADTLDGRGLSLLLEAEGDPETLSSALLYLERALHQSPELASAQVHRIEVLLQLDQLPQALDAMDRLITQTNDREHRLLRCMLVEWVQPTVGDHRGCYQAVADEVLATDGKAAKHNSQYLLALKMAEDPDFSARAAAFLRNLEGEMAKTVFSGLLLESPREAVIAHRLHRH
ncbi:MAG: hypothetical protein EA349_13785 [Halomonadaceae bacterium]|nr:MAG: hypothetical protein EA349_13785 [Halomonadaceae bacterium]